MVVHIVLHFGKNLRIIYYAKQNTKSTSRGRTLSLILISKKINYVLSSPDPEPGRLGRGPGASSSSPGLRHLVFFFFFFFFSCE